MRVHRIPASTYRLQLGPRLGFRQARELLPYLQSLGITTLYVSPLLQSVRGGHGYDVTDPRRPNEALGTADDLRGLCDAAVAADMDIVVDIVPNHMAASLENPFWRDVIEKGRASRFAGIFDIDWDAPEAGGRLVLPMLLSDVEEMAAAGEVRLEWNAEEGEFLIVCGQLRFPLSPWSYERVLSAGGTDAERFHARAADARTSRERHSAEAWPEAFAPVLAAMQALPSPHDATRTGRERLAATTTTLKQRLGQSVRTSSAAAAYIRARVAAFGPGRADGGGTAHISALLTSQPYRLLPWRAGSRIVNYRRFFDIADLVAVRQDEPGVFELTHGFLLELLEHPGVAGFRVDHIDGLNDPRGYLERLREEAGDAYIVVEKILAEGERIPGSWPVDGTTGYEMAADIDRLLVDGRGWSLLRSAYESFSGEAVPAFRSLARDSKREVLSALFPQEVRTLARELPGVHPRPEMPEEPNAATAAAVIEATAALHVYRTYFGDPSRDRDSERWVRNMAGALDSAGHECRGSVTEQVLRTIAAAPAGGPGLQWTMRWQRLTGAAAAKGVEDTALYRYPVLLSRNEVGSEPDAPPLDPAGFHARMHRRHEHGRGSLSATSTHDSKRDEDARGRLHVLSERAGEWAGVVRRWHDLNTPLLGRIGSAQVPDPAEENLVYQSIVALWPLRPRDEEAATERLCRYVVKAMREAKRLTSWIDPSAEREAAVERFVRSALAPGRRGFLAEVRGFVRSVAASGAVNTLAMVLLRVTVPGIPDTYQGKELWTAPRLVDPDNREAVDFALRRRLLEDLDRQEAGDRAALLTDLVSDWDDGRLKLFVLSRALRFRRAQERLFSLGEYVELETRGSPSDAVFACARRHADAWVVCLVPRLSHHLRRAGQVRCDTGCLSDLCVELPDGAPETWTDVLSGHRLHARGGALRVSEAFDPLPATLLAPDDETRPACATATDHEAQGGLSRVRSSGAERTPPASGSGQGDGRSR